MENVKKFYDALTTNEALKAKAAKLNEKHAGTKPDETALAKEIIAFAAAEGYSFTQEELTAYSESMKKSSLSDDELEAVAGGNPSGTCENWDLCFCAAGGGGVHRNPKITCVCVLYGQGDCCKCRPQSYLFCLAAGLIVNC